MNYKSMFRSIGTLLIIMISVVIVHSEERITATNNPSISEELDSSSDSSIGTEIRLTVIEDGNTIILIWSPVDEAIAYEIYFYYQPDNLIYLDRTTETTYRIVKDYRDNSDRTYVVCPVYKMTRRGHRLKKGGLDR